MEDHQTPQADEIVNRVAASPLRTFDLEEFYTPGERIVLDIKPWLYEGLILREKDFRQRIKEHHWQLYKGKYVSVVCSADAIVPTWAFMLVAVALQPVAAKVVLGSQEQLETQLFFEALAAVPWHEYEGAKVVVKGCSKVAVPEAVYVEVTTRLAPRVSSLMFGEPCSTVPLYKKPKNA
jgi:hypothetical protein